MEGINLESFLNTEIETVIKELQSFNKKEERSERIKLNKKQITEINEDLNKIKAFLFKLPEFSNTQEVADSLNENKLKEIETKWYSKINKKKNEWKSIKLHKRLYGFLSPYKCDSWDIEKIDEFINSIKF